MIALAVQLLAFVNSLEMITAVAASCLFLIGFLVWGIAFWIAAARSRAGEAVELPVLLLAGSQVPLRIRVHLYGALTATIAIVGSTAWRAPFGILVPFLSLGLVLLWGACFSVADSRFLDQGQRDEPLHPSQA